MSRALELDDADIVPVWTRRSALLVSRVGNGVETVRRLRPTGRLAPAEAEDPDHAVSALAEWMPGTDVSRPRHTVLSGTLRSAFAGVCPEPKRQSLLVGAHVEQAFDVGGGTFEFTTVLEPGEHDARRRSDVTGERLDSGVVDRSNHFVAGAATCPYCSQLSCPLCAVQIVACAGCGVSLCTSCRQEVGGVDLCAACASVRPATRSEARQHGRHLSAKGMLVGTDPLHTVVYEREKSGWVRHVDGAKPVEAPAPVVAHLTARSETPGG
jgi:hypothetical protein